MFANVAIQAVSEPSTSALLSAGVACGAIFIRCRKTLEAVEARRITLILALRRYDSQARHESFNRTVVTQIIDLPGFQDLKRCPAE